MPHLELPPGWVCEVLSPGTRRLDRMVKLPLYAQAGVPHVWLVDPRARTLEVLALSDGGAWVLAGNFVGEGPVHAPPFEAAALELGALWLPGAEE